MGSRRLVDRLSVVRFLDQSSYSHVALTYLEFPLCYASLKEPSKHSMTFNISKRKKQILRI